MSLYENNMDCMKLHKKALYQAIQEADTTGISNKPEAIASVNTRTNEMALTVKQDGINYRLNSSYNPKEEAARWVKQYQFLHLENIITMFGLGNGVFARTIAGHMGEKDTLLIYEPSYDILNHVLNHYDITDVIENDKIILTIEGINTFYFHNCLMVTMNINNLRDQIICMHPNYDVIFNDSCVWFWNQMKEVYAHTKININTMIHFGERMIVNTLSNFKYLTDSNTIIEMQEHMPRNLPVIVVSAGPSVRNQIASLKKAKGKAIIIAVDRILDYLLDEGLEPDFVTTLDPKKPVKYFSKRDNVTIPLLCFVESNYEIFELHKGRKIICNTSPFLSLLYYKNNIMPPSMNSGASVATTAFTACLALGFTKIILVGQDLAYDGNLSHAGGINEEHLTDRDTMIEGVDGQMIRSRTDWKEFALWFGDMIQLYPHITVIDAKEKGAKIEGAINMSIEEALEEHGSDTERFDFDINCLEPTFDHKIYSDMIDYFQENIDTLDSIKKRVKKVITKCNTLVKMTKQDKIPQNLAAYSSEINDTIEYIKEQPIYHLIDIYISASSAQCVSEMYQLTEDERENVIQTYEKSKQIFKTILKAIEFIEPKLSEAVIYCKEKE